MRQGVILLCFFAAVFSGCTLLRCSEGIDTLKALSRSGDEINAYLTGQENKFFLLRDRVREGVLEPGMQQEEIVSSYGDPVLSREEETASGTSTVLLYRHPTDFFNSDRIYLYFDAQGGLVSWEYVPSR